MIRTLLLTLFTCWILFYSKSSYSVYLQLRGEAGKRQVEGARIGLQHNFGIGGAAVVTMYRKIGVRPSKL